MDWRLIGRVPIQSGGLGPIPLVLRIHDDGKGLPATASGSSGGHGLRSIQARATMLRGDIAIASQPGQGTSITLRVPT